MVALGVVVVETERSETASCLNVSTNWFLSSSTPLLGRGDDVVV